MYDHRVHSKLVIAAFAMTSACGASPPAPQARAAPTAPPPASQPTGIPIAEWGRLTRASASPPIASSPIAGAACISGVVTDAQTGDVMPGVTVVATATALQETQSAITDERGVYRISDLPPGDYKVSFFFADITIEQDNIHVGVHGFASVNQKIDQTQTGGQTIKIEVRASNVTPLPALPARCD